MAVAVETSPQEILNHSNYSIQNRRFGKVMHEESLHPNEDASCAGSFMDWNMYAVFDGHDGLNAVQFFKEELPRHIRDKFPSKEVLETAFKEADKSFFASLEHPMRDRNAIIKKLKGLNSYEAYIQYPQEVRQLQVLDAAICGGTTAAVVLIDPNKGTLWGANVGDSQIILFKEGQDFYHLLSKDHTTENEAELERLQGLGLNKDELIKNKRLGSCENTRSLGDYCLKFGYKEVDSIQHATSAPGIPDPFVFGPVSLDPNDVVVLMTDGVYKLIETLSDENKEDPHEGRLLRTLLTKYEYKAQAILDELVDELHKMYSEHVDNPDAESQRKAQIARKHDDMTLTIIGPVIGNSVIGTSV